MAQAFISTGQPNLRQMSVDSVAASFTNRVPTDVKPTSGVVLDMDLTQGYASPSLIRITPYGRRSDNNTWTTSGATTSVRLIGWQKFDDRNNSGDIWWMPTILAQYSLLFASGATLYSFGTPGDIGFFGGGTNPSAPVFPPVNVYTPGGTAAGSITTPASWLVDLAGAQLVTADFIAPAPGGGVTITMGLFWYAI
jgi:hypothetical protein